MKEPSTNDTWLHGLITFIFIPCTLVSRELVLCHLLRRNFTWSSAVRIRAQFLCPSLLDSRWSYAYQEFWLNHDSLSKPSFSFNLLLSNPGALEVWIRSNKKCMWPGCTDEGWSFAKAGGRKAFGGNPANFRSVPRTATTSRASTWNHGVSLPFVFGLHQSFRTKSRLENDFLQHSEKMVAMFAVSFAQRARYVRGMSKLEICDPFINRFLLLAGGRQN